MTQEAAGALALLTGLSTVLFYKFWTSRPRVTHTVSDAYVFRRILMAAITLVAGAVATLSLALEGLGVLSAFEALG